jgi:uncharacterized protein (DUF2252 family)
MSSGAPPLLGALHQSRSARDIVWRIATFNAGREPERLALKYQVMRRNAFAFLRGTAHIFWEDWSARAVAGDDALLVWATGDLHVENVGAFRGDNRLVYFDLDDFDESALAPPTWEVGRFLTSVHVGATVIGVSAIDAAHLAATFLEAYVDALRDGKARWVERATATGMVKELLASAKGRTREALLGARTVVRRGQRTLRLDGRRSLAIRRHDRLRVAAAIHRLARSTPNPEFYEVLDVARRVAGTASLGLERYVALVRGTGSPDGNFLLDVKAARPSALAPYVRRPQPTWTSDAERIVRIQHRMQAISPALLHTVKVHGEDFVLRELQPTEDRLALEHWHGKLGRLRKVMTTIGQLVAWAQLRSSSRDGSAHVDELIELAHRREWRYDVLRSARAYAAIVQRDWRTFKRASEDELA